MDCATCISLYGRSRSVLLQRRRISGTSGELAEPERPANLETAKFGNYIHTPDKWTLFSGYPVPSRHTAAPSLNRSFSRQGTPTMTLLG